MDGRKPLSQKDKKRLEKQRKTVAKQAQRFHKEQEKKAKKSTQKSSGSKIARAVNSRPQKRDENLSREEKFRRESEKKIRNLKPKDYDDGYYIDEYGERKKQERRAKEIHEQEKEVIRKRKKPLSSSQIKRRRILIYSAIFVVVLVAGAALSLTVLFKTENITVEGNEYYTDEQIIAFSGVEKQENIFIAAITGDAQRISDRLSYIEQASISFSVPDTVIIKVTNASPSYVIKNGGKYLLISSKGRILEEIPENADKLPELKCDELKSTSVGSYVSFSDENVPEILQNISESLEKNKIEKITGFDVTDTSDITLDYDNRITIKIGLPEDIDYKIRTAMAIINEKLDPNNTGTITGTLDVSACSTTKISHYKPAETLPQPSTQPSTAAPQDDNADAYTWDGADSGDVYSDGDIYGDGTNAGVYDGGSIYDDGTNDGVNDDGGVYGDGANDGSIYGDGTNGGEYYGESSAVY